MADIKFNYIGWCNEVDRKTGSKHDKVWTAFEIDGTHYAGWGARGKKLSFKNHGKNIWGGQSMPSTLSAVVSSKRKKYNEVDTFQLFAVFPYFQEEVDKQLFFKILANKIM